MKVILVNGGTGTEGSTAVALDMVGKGLRAEGVETETVWIGSTSVGDFLERAAEADGFVFGSQDGFGSAAAGMSSFMDGVFCSCAGNPDNPLRLKPAATVSTARRAVPTPMTERFNMYFGTADMPMVTDDPAVARNDMAGSMGRLASNMAYAVRRMGMVRGALEGRAAHAGAEADMVSESARSRTDAVFLALITGSRSPEFQSARC